MNNLVKILLVSLPDREGLVAEIWIGKSKFAELSKQKGVLLFEIYSPLNNICWNLEFDNLLDILNAAKAKLEISLDLQTN